jgi:hypothetical protein
VLDRYGHEDDRGKSIDAKITALIAGVLAFIGLSARFPVSLWTAVETIVFLAPLGVLLGAFMTERGRLAPTAESLGTFFPEYPVTTLRDAIDAMTRVCRSNARINDRKAARLDIAVVLTGVIAAVVFVLRVVIALR